MNSRNVLPDISLCDPSGDLLPFLQQIVLESKSKRKRLYCSVTLETGYFDPLAILEGINNPRDSNCYMEKPADEFSIACGESVAKASFSGSDRFTKARIWSDELLMHTRNAGKLALSGSGPTHFLSATFETEKRSDDSPDPLHIFFPRWQVLRKGGVHLLTVNAEINPFSSPSKLKEELDESICQIKGMRYEQPRSSIINSTKFDSPMENLNYLDAVRKALCEIHSGKLSKIVLARQLHYDTKCEISSFSIAHLLRDRYPDCFTFCLSTPNKGTMVGATPETLLRVSGSNLETEAIAGSAPRGPSAGRDALWGKTLLGQEKAIHEHRLVIESIIRRLASIGLTNSMECKTRLLRLANLQHMRTPIRAKLANGIHPFDALDALHPTPAMGGTPREEAIPLIRKLEKTSRGWYSGVAGWMDGRGHGEFIVPIRCGKITPSNLTLYAGAGVVDGSVPEQEKIETDWKLEAMLEVITGRTNLIGE